MQRTKVVCELCGQEISKSNYTKHLRRHQDHPETFKDSLWKLTHEGLNCQYCDYTAATRNGLMTHERVCRYNPNRMKTAYELHPEKFERFKGYGSLCGVWNKGLTKETDERLARRGVALHNRYVSGDLTPSFIGRHHTERTKQLLRDYAIKNHLGGHPYRKDYSYKGLHFDSSYEVTVAKELDEHNILWEKSRSFPYVVEGVEHQYTPDFYLPEYNVYLDPKNDFLIENINPALGYKDLDKIKWVEEKHDIRVLVLDKDHLDWNSILELIDALVA